MKSINKILIFFTTFFLLYNCGRSVDLVVYTLEEGQSNTETGETLTPLSKRINLKDRLSRKNYGLKIDTDSILFKYNSTEMLSAKDAIKQIISFTKLLENESDIKYKIIVTGHADKRGNKDFNKKLSIERGKKIYDILINVYSVLNNKDENDKNNIFEYAGRGDKYPLLGDYQKNRRVEFLFIVLSDPKGKLLLS